MCTMLAASGAACGLMLLLCVGGINTQDVPYDTSVSEGGGRGGWSTFRGLYELLAQHDALGAGHALARKDVRSPSRRLRFGRRSDPDMPPQIPIEDPYEPLGLRETRTPVRLRFGRRSDEKVMPHFFPEENFDRDVRVPSMRLRFGRSDNNMFAVPIEQAAPKEVKVAGSTDENGRQQE